MDSRSLAPTPSKDSKLFPLAVPSTDSRALPPVAPSMESRLLTPVAPSVESRLLPPVAPSMESRLLPSVAPSRSKQLAPIPNAMQQLIKSDHRNALMSSDDAAMIRHIQETHTPDGREFDVKPLLQLVDEILSRATIRATEAALLPGAQPLSTEIAEEKAHHASVISMLDALSYLIDRISCEIACKCFSGSDAHATTVSIVTMLASYQWDAKLVITLAAFALNYGEFWLLAQIHLSNNLAKSMAILRQVPVIVEHSVALKPRFDALNKLITVMLDVTRCLIELKELPSSYITQDVAELNAAKAFVPTAVYWTIRSVVACATQIHSLSSMGHEYVSSTTEAWELSTLAHKLGNILEHLSKIKEFCFQIIDKKKEDEYLAMIRAVFATMQVDNQKALKLLIYNKDDILPLVDGTPNKNKVGIDFLKRKYVLLLISGLDISTDELSILEQIYNESRPHSSRMDSHYEMVWMPIRDPTVEWNSKMQTQFESLVGTMPWHSVQHPNLIHKAVVRFIREDWQYRNRPILVVLDPQGKMVSPNAIHMMWIWGSSAFPFTISREEALWKEETWRLELLVDGVDPTILNWIKEDKYILLYGGDDLEWIRKLTAAARSMASTVRIPLEMVYVGKSGKKEQQLRRITNAVANDKLSHCWQEHPLMWFFWTRLESMLFSKLQLNQADDLDPMTREIKKLLSYDKHLGWVVLSRGSSVIFVADAISALTVFAEVEAWKKAVDEVGFSRAITDHLERYRGQDDHRPCCRFEFNSMARSIPLMLKCPECLAAMEKHTTFICCHTDSPIIPPN